MSFHDDERLLVSQGIKELLDCREDQGAGMDRLKIPSRHLKDELGVAGHGNDDAGSTLDTTDGLIDGLGVCDGEIWWREDEEE